MATAHQDYQDYQQKQHDYQTQALQEAERGKQTTGSYFQGWGQWVLDGMKSIFDSTAEKLVEKYARLPSFLSHLCVHAVPLNAAVIVFF